VSALATIVTAAAAIAAAAAVASGSPGAAGHPEARADATAPATAAEPGRTAAPALDATARLQTANARYLAGEFEEAARAYAALAADGVAGPTLHLNRGNALLRAGQRGAAVASYLRALREAPLDADAAWNLALARGANVDRLVGVPQRPLHARVAARTPDAAAAAAFAVPWSLLWLALAARRLGPAGARPSLGAAALLLAAAAALGAGLLAARDAELRRTLAVVVVESAPAREAPEAALRPAFQVHEGTEVEVLELRGDAARVRLGNGLEGWVEARALEAV
jgi:tetratricopeptide (TPR) repeat protein